MFLFSAPRGDRALLAALGVLLLTAACSDREAPASDVPVFIISIDTLRADRLPAYGYTQGSTPAIDRLRADSILYEQAYSHVPLTLPSHASLFTGLLPPDHGVRDNIGYLLSGEVSTLPGMLRSRGYVTGAAVSTWVLRRETGIASGFDFYDDETDPARQMGRRAEERDGERSRLAFAEWLGRQTTRRLFGFLHLFEPHAPYEPPPPFDAAAHRYDGEVSYADSIVGRFLDDLRGRGLYDPALIILLSDHGEGLGDHGEDEHGVFLYRESIQVPLLIKLPRNERAGETVRHPVGLIDIVPTVLAVTAAGDPATFSGAVLTRPDFTAGRAIYGETYFPPLHLGWSELFAMIDANFHYIDAPRPELYAISDTRQQHNVLEQHRRAVFALRERLAAIDRKFTPPSDVDPEDQKRLAALGYLGSTRASEGPLPDPKDHIESIRMLKTALESFQNAAYEDALRRAKELLEKNPMMVDGWILQAGAERRLGRRDDALSTIRNGLQRFPTHPDLQLAAAEVLLELKRFDDAAAHAELAIKEDAAAAREMLARIAIARDDLASAERHLTEIDGRSNPRPSTLLLLADVRKRQRRFQEELALIDRAIEEVRRRRIDAIERLHYERGIALLELRQPHSAAAAFREEIRLFPNNIEAWGMLAVALGIEGKSNEARETLREAVRVNPGAAARTMAADTLRVLEGARQAQ
ncbi:MAG TPA: sulfatase-like hydrolase/transferase [Thermoanaerobaculia bacterium]|nr:sulfatase-like hydrolase/transferase [Thermoanaerobaculia bacterium]